MAKFAITLAEFNRIHRVVHGVIRDQARAEVGCMFFAVMGARLLERHFGIECRPVAGGFALCTSDAGPAGLVISQFGRREDGRLVPAEDAFHMWVRTPEHHIDFMSPIYEEAFRTRHPGAEIPRRMFQRPLRDEIPPAGRFARVGDFQCEIDVEMTIEKVRRFHERPGNRDFVEVADAWFGKRRQPQQAEMGMGSDDGSVTRLVLPDTVARSPW